MCTVRISPFFLCLFVPRDQVSYFYFFYFYFNGEGGRLQEDVNNKSKTYTVRDARWHISLFLFRIKARLGT